MPVLYKATTPDDARFMKLAIDQARLGLARAAYRSEPHWSRMEW
jgi:hypothetical protein